MTNDELITSLESLRNLMIAVATGGPRIADVNMQYQRLFAAVAAELARRHMDNPITYATLWDWYGRWSSGDLPSYQSRRTFVGELINPTRSSIVFARDARRKATDVAKGAASVVLTDEGLSGIVTLVEQGRVIYQRILTWIINKISRTILKSAFVTIAFLATGRFVISAFGMLLLVFLTDFAKIALATDHVRWSRAPDSWRSKGHIQIAAVLGVVMVIEALGLLAIGWRMFDLVANDEALHTFTFQTLFYFALFSIVSIRERRRFWASRPSGILTLALVLDAVVGTFLSTIGIPGLAPLPWTQTVFVFSYAMIFALLINDVLKVAMMNRVGLST